jgi:hypothetical protein
VIVWAAANDIGIVLVLAVILPEADFANLEIATRLQGPVLAARAKIARHGTPRFVDALPNHRGIPSMAA